MEYLVQFQLNIYALIILSILYITIFFRSRVDDFGKKLFIGAIIVVGIAVVIEPLTWIFDGKIFFGSYFLEYFTNFVLILIAPIICCFMLYYVDYYIFKDSKRISKPHYYIWPAFLTFILLIVNIFYPIYFTVSITDNTYSLGNLYWIQNVLVGIYYIYMLAFILLNRKKTFHYAITIFVIFFSLPIIGMVIQLFIYEFFFTWTSIVLSLIVIYIFLESTSLDQDYLTKLYSRQSYEKYVNYMIGTEKPFTILFIDLDKFKEINDKLGHFVGDKVLVEFGRTLVKVFKPNHMVSRLGGDEFLVVIENVLVIEESIEAVYKLLSKHEDEAISNLEFSYGYQQFEKNMTIDKLYINADRKMYEHKKKKR